MNAASRRALLRNIAYGFSALVLAGGWVFFYVQSRAVDLNAAVDALGTLSELRAVDRRWNDRLLRGQPPEPESTRPLGSSPQSLDSLHARLRYQVFRFTTQVPGQELDELRNAFAEKAALMEGVFSSREVRDPLLEQAWFSSTGPRLDLVGHSLQSALGKTLDDSELYRMFLLYYSGFLILVLGHLVWRLASSRAHIDRINQELRDANQTLETRVEERTRELSDALQKLKESEAMLIQSEKMSSLGRMVAGIAHEVNTPLAYVKASLEAARGWMENDNKLAAETHTLLELIAAESPDPAKLEATFSSVQGILDDIRKREVHEQMGKALGDGLYGIGQISEIVSNLKNFSRLDRSKASNYDLRVGLESTLRIAHDVLKNREVRKDFKPIPPVPCSPSQINQVFLNLISNAAQATGDDGLIILSTGTSGEDEVWVDVIDNGQGIPPEVLPKIFDPFFTTKEVGKGTGLGLAICYKIVQNHGGRLEVESTPGVGTRFRVTLPVTQTEAVSA